MTINKNDKIEVNIPKQIRRRWSPSEKRAIVQETYETGVTL